jgi:hypothetical protein
MPDNPLINLASAWGVNLEGAVCEHGDWSYLLPLGRLPLQCPNCLQAALSPLAEQVDDLPYNQPPELCLPFSVATDRLSQNIQNFASRIWFAPGDLKPSNLKERLQRLYLPMWLVDSRVQATWQAEAGFNYEAVSHQDQFDENKGGWVSRRVTETRIRWAPRLGRLRRAYHNIVAPALEEHSALKQKLGPYKLDTAQPYRAESLANTMVRLPNRAPVDAWPEAIPPIQSAAAEECRRACQADHWREFRWQAEYANQHWTLLLLPIYLTYYLDDDDHSQPILIHGQTGQLSGPQRASMKRAQRMALIIVAVAVIFFLLSLIVALASIFRPPLLLIAGIGLVMALIIGLLALLPLAIAWQFNRTNR